ncbi:ABC-F family ATP-binding cassette domain-containing protein [Aerococcus sp. JJEM-2022a]|uniref:ABC-F family ATP-binding cassette domain-containing protein n=1 Tax=Aerococcus loyolae TaxID=2976809 RepID=UPI0022778778|nr:ABC-F family ATP-binding cassette domain-containing protein [Aerococcus loyolae]MCY3028944.1 ABC-F family ATP-binding cassette domain-containing protein [Aerococcus loyolae]
MIVLQGSKLMRRFGSDILFQDVQMTIQDNSRTALVGRNGTGKSTLLKILAGIEEPDQGQVTRAKGKTIAYMDQHAAIENSQRTIYEEMRSVFKESIALIHNAEQAAQDLADAQDEASYQEALKRYDQLQEEVNQSNAYGYDSEIRMVLHGFQFPESDYDKPINQLSGGQRTRLALAKVLLEKRDILILDEPTNHLDIETLTWLEDYLPSYPGALLIVSHDRYFLDHVTNETYEMTGHSMEYYKGNYSFYLKEKAVRLESWQKAYDKQQKKIAKLEDYVARNLVRASTTKMAQSRRKQLEKMPKIEKPKQDEKSPHIQFLTDKASGNVVLAADHLGIGYDDHLLSYPIEIDIRKQQAIAVVGPNGVGKSTLLKTIIQEIPAIKGEIHYGANVTIGYYDQELAKLHSNKDVLHELWDDHPTINEENIRTILGSFLFSGQDVEKSVAMLSGGEKARLALAKLSFNHDNFLVLDEPTNHLDIDSKEILENALIAYDGTLLFVSHDRYFINRIATQVLEISPEGSTLYLGDYDYYLNKKAEQEARLAEENKENQSSLTEEKQAPSQSAKAYQNRKERQKEERKLQRQSEKIEASIEDLDEEIAEIQEKMTDPDILQNYYELNQLDQSLKDKQAQQEALFKEWETVQSRLEDFDQ